MCVCEDPYREREAKSFGGNSKLFKNVVSYEVRDGRFGRMRARIEHI